MSWSKDKNGTWVWTADGKGNPNKPGDNQAPRPTFDMGAGATGNTGSSVYTVDVGFGLVDKDGKPLALPPIQIGSYITTLAGTDAKAYARVKNAVAKLTGRKTLDPSYVGGYVSKLATNIMGSSDIIARTGTLEDYFNAAAKNAAASTKTSLPQSYVSSPTQAKSDINTVFQNILGRDASDKEIKSLTVKLNNAQKKNPSKYVNGVTYGGLDKNQFLTDIVKETPEYKKVKAEKEQVKLSKELSYKDILAKTAMANGLDINQFADADQWASRIAAGEPIETFKQTIRNTVNRGMPESIKNLLDQGVDLDTIFSPYKQTMASILEINPNAISVNDPTLRMAIGPDKEMSIYDFQNALRKDARWQYTNNAKESVSNSVQKVLKDFGFMG